MSSDTEIEAKEDTNADSSAFERLKQEVIDAGNPASVDDAADASEKTPGAEAEKKADDSIAETIPAAKPAKIVDPLDEIRKGYAQLQSDMKTLIDRQLATETRNQAPVPPWTPTAAPAALDPDQCADPELAKAFNAQSSRIVEIGKENAEIKARLAALGQTTDSVARSENARQMQAVVAMLDAEFASRKDFADVFGEGPGASFAPDSPQTKERSKVLEAMHHFIAGARAVGKNPPPVPEAFRMALYATHGEDIAKRREDAARTAIIERRGMASQRPTSRRTGSGATPEDKNVAELDDMLATFRKG